MPDSIAALAELLQATTAEDRVRAAESLAQKGMEAAGAAVALVRACADEAEEVREAATAALEAMGPPNSEDVAALIALLSEKSVDVGYWAATLLGRLEEDAAGAVAALVTALTNSASMPLRERAAWALGRIGARAAEATAALQQAAALQEPRLARLAREALDRVHVRRP